MSPKILHILSRICLHRLKDFSRSQTIIYDAKVVILLKRCKMECNRVSGLESFSSCTVQTLYRSTSIYVSLDALVPNILSRV